MGNKEGERNTWLNSLLSPMARVHGNKSLT